MRTFVKHSFLNFLGQALPLFIALLAFPVSASGYGIDRFALLSITWTLQVYFMYFDLGIGRGATKFAAEALGSGRAHEIPSLLRFSTTVNLALGAAGGVLVWFLSPVLPRAVFTVPPQLVAEAETMFRLLAWSIPAITAMSLFRGFLEAAGRFDISNGVRIPATSFLFLIPLAGVWLGWDLNTVIFWIVVSRHAAALAYYAGVARAYPREDTRAAGTYGGKKSLLRFGGWVSVSNLLLPLISNCERIIIPILLPLRALSYYTAPFEMLSRISILPGSLTQTLFPRFSAAAAEDAAVVRSRFILKPTRYLIFLLTPPIFILILFAGEILTVWMGAEFARQSTAVFAVLAAAFYVNALAYIPFTAVQGLGRPDLIAKMNMVEAVLLLALCWLLVQRAGIEGAALSRLVFSAVDGIVLVAFTRRILRSTWREFFPARSYATYGTSALVIAVAGAAAYGHAGFGLKLALAAAVGAAYIFVFWRHAIPGEDKAEFRRLLAFRANGEMRRP